LPDPVAAIPARHGYGAGAANGVARLGRGGGRLDHRGRLRERVPAAGADAARAARSRPRRARVIYLGTFSKLVFPALRLGYAVLPEDLVRPFTAARHLADRQSSSLLQAIMTEFMLGGHFARHLKLMRAIYAERQAFLIAEAERRLGGWLTIRPQGCGIYVP